MALRVALQGLAGVEVGPTAAAVQAVDEDQEVVEVEDLLEAVVAGVRIARLSPRAARPAAAAVARWVRTGPQSEATRYAPGQWSRALRVWLREASPQWASQAHQAPELSVLPT